MSKLFVLAICLVSFGCSSGGSSTSESKPPSSSSSSSSGLIADKIDCSNLNPDKVYIFGTLQEDERLYAIADIEDPTNFCVGFNETHIYTGVISSSGEYIYAVSGSSNEPILSLITEEIFKDTENRWVYPSFASGDDTVLFTQPNEECGLSTIKLQPTSDEIYYSCPNQLINTTHTQPLFDIGNNAENKLLTVLPDGGMLLVDDPMGIKYVDPNQNELLLKMPSDSRYLFGSARQFVDPKSGNLSVWIAASENLSEFYGAPDWRREELFHRLKVDMITMEVVNEGQFAPLPMGFTAFYFNEELDRDGNLYQPGRSIQDPDDNWIVKRSIKTIGATSTVVYKESDHYLREVYTGPERQCTEQELVFGDTDSCNDGIYDWREQENLFVKYDRLVTGM